MKILETSREQQIDIEDLDASKQSESLRLRQTKKDNTLQAAAQNRHDEESVVPAQRMGVNMTFEEQMALYDSQIN